LTTVTGLKLESIHCASKNVSSDFHPLVDRESGVVSVQSVYVARFSRDAWDSEAEHSSDEELSEPGSADEMQLPWNHDATTSPTTRSGRWLWCSVI